MARFMQLVVVAALCLVPAAVRGQEVIARDVYIDEHLVSVDDVEFLRDAARFSPEQTEAAMTLLAGCRERLAIAQRRMERAEHRRRQINNDEEQGREYRRIIGKFVEDSAAAELEFMTDLKSLLSAGQEEAWQRFERSRRRLLIRNTVHLERIDLVNLLRAAVGTTGKGPIPEFSSPELASAVEQYEQEMDLLVQQRRPLAKVLGRGTHGWAEEREDNEKAEEDCRAVAIRIMELHARTSRVFARFLNDAQRDEFDTRYIRAIWGDTLPKFLRDGEVGQLLRVRGLTRQQQDRIKEIASVAEKDLLEACRSRIGRWEQAAIANLRNERLEDNENFYETFIEKAYAQVRREAYGVLTPAQREAFENGEDPLEGPGLEESGAGRRPDEY